MCLVREKKRKRSRGGSASVDELPWDHWMQTALGKMGISPVVFWDMSFPEFYAAIEGFAEFHSGGKPPSLRKNDLEELMELYPD